LILVDIIATGAAEVTLEYDGFHVEQEDLHKAWWCTVRDYKSVNYNVRNRHHGSTALEVAQAALVEARKDEEKKKADAARREATFRGSDNQ
jgi:hypothetical protein